MSGAALLLARADHPNVAALAEELPRHGLEPRVLDPRAFPARARMSLHLGRGSRARVDTDLADVEDARVGWFTSYDGPSLASDLAPRARRFAMAASVAGLVSLRNAPGIPWVNDPHAAARSADKLEQLVHARACGLEVPETLVTNDPSALRAFVRKHRRAAVKSPSGSAGLPDSKRVLTQLVTPRSLGDASSVALAPLIAQAYVDKRSEVRATVVGGRVHAVEIHSQETPSTRVDWRRYDPRTRHERLALPGEVRRGCVAVARACGLDYTGIDLVRTPDDRYVFLEANSEPAWLWLEEATGVPITRDLAALLARRAKAR